MAEARIAREPIKFPFINSLALRIANLISSDIEALEKEAFGVLTGWQKYDRPLKAHYANSLARRAGNSVDAMVKITAHLKDYEANAQAYMAKPNQRGRPLTQFVHCSPEEYELKQRAAYGSKRKVQFAQDDDESANEASLEVQAAGGAGAMPVKTFKMADGSQVESIKVVVPKPALKRETKQDLQQAMEGNATPNVGEDRMREIAQEVVEEAAPQILRAANADAKHEINKSVPGMIKQALDGLIPTRVKVVHPDGSVVAMGVQHKQFPLLVQTLPRFPVWLPGPAGSGKTTAARNAARALSVDFHHHGAVDNVYQLLGFIDAGGRYHPTSFRAAYEHGGVFLWDEVDASNPAALVAFNAAIENGECVFPDKTIVKHPSCYFAAAANTYGTGATHEYVGRTKLDAATLDRFVMLDWDYDEALEIAIAGNTSWTKYVQSVRAACKKAGIKHLVTPRASIRGNALLAAGIEPEQVIAMTIRKGLAEDHWRTISSNTRYQHIAQGVAA